MAESEDKHSGQPDLANDSDCANDEDCAWPNLASEALAHMQIHCEQFQTHVRTFLNEADVVEVQQLADDLCRMRNTLVILEKPALAFVVEELLKFLDVLPGEQVHIPADMKDVLSLAADALGNHVALMQQDTSKDDALALVPLINDCRACREEMLISDVLLLAAGVQAPTTHSLTASEGSWPEQYQLWQDRIVKQGSGLAENLSCWEGGVGADSAVLLVRELDALASFSAQYTYLGSLESLFQCASLLVHAVSREQLSYGVALKSLFVQIENTVSAGKVAETPADLVPSDLLRNCLYYVAQVDSESTTALTLRRRFRLDRIRQISNQSRHVNTPTIGVVYHLTSAVRSGVARESAELRAWLDTAEKPDVPPPSTTRLRVRLQQLQPVLTLLGTKQSVVSLNNLIERLQDLSSDPTVSGECREELGAAISDLDTLLDRSARQSILRRQSAVRRGDTVIDAYADIAVDTCLREARDELQIFMDRLLVSLQSGQFDDAERIKLTNKLSLIDSALQVLPLPELRPVFDSFKQLLNQQLGLLYETGINSDTATTRFLPPRVTHKVHDRLVSLHVSLDDYLSCVMQPQIDANQFFNEAQIALDQLISEMQSEDFYIDTDAISDKQSSLAQAQNTQTLSLSDIGSLTLNVEADVLQLSSEDDESTKVDSTLNRLFHDECVSYLDNLDECVNQALGPAINPAARLPNEKMLRALHSLTSNSQTMGIADIAAISQPLQRASLALHRKGRYFGTSETYTIGKLVDVLRLKLESISAGRPIDGAVVELERQLSDVLQHAASSAREAPDTRSTSSAIGSPTSSIADVFYDEATELLDQLHSCIRAKPFDSRSVNSALSIMHTLKGSARLSGTTAVSECAHEIETQVQSNTSIDKQLGVLKDGCQTLQAHLLRSSERCSAVNTNGPAFLPSHEPNLATDSEGDKALDFAFDLSVKQAKLGDELERVRALGRDIQAKLALVQNELHDSQRPPEVRLKAIIDDLEVSGSALRETLARANRGYQESSRASATLRDALVRARITRFDVMHQRLGEAIVDAVGTSGKQVQLQLSGGELMIDKVLSRQLVVLLEHLVNNAVIHGIESPGVRSDKGKSASGVIALEATTDGSELLVVLTDDGRGIDLDTMNALLYQSGKARVETPADLQELLFSSGYSSIINADALAGHGLGLPAVRTAIEHLRGTIELKNNPSHGFSVTLRIPQPLLVCRSVLVREGKRLYGIPVTRVKSVNVGSKKEGVKVDVDKRIPRTVTLSYLIASMLFTDKKPIQATQHHRPSLQIEHHEGVINVTVDKLIGYRELVVQPLGAQIAKLGQFSAGGIYSTGEQVLIVDLPSMLDAESETEVNPEQSPVEHPVVSED